MSEHVVHNEVATDMPLQTSSLERLSQRELNRYQQVRLLLDLGGGLQAILLKDIPLAGLGVFEAFLGKSWASRYVNPEVTIRFAQAALDVAHELDSRRYGAKRVADLQARAWGELANTYRAADRLHLAQQAFGQAYALFRKGSDDLYLKARLFDLEASLLGTWREFPAAFHRLKTLSDLYQELGEVHLAGRALITRALYTAYSGQAEEAVQVSSRGLALIDRKRDPVLYMMAVHNHLMSLAELGNYRQAKRTLFENRRHLIYRGIGALRFRRTEGRISYGLGELASAEIAFREAKEGFATFGMSYHAAGSAMELSITLARQGKTTEAEKEAVFAREIFLSQKVSREYIGATICLKSISSDRKLKPRHLR